MKFLKYLNVILIASLQTLCYSQDTINHISGKAFIGEIIDTTDMFVVLKYSKNDKIKQKAFDKLDIYEVKFKDSTSKIYYFQDSIMGNYLSVSQMGYYVKGEHDALIYYKPSVAVKASGLLTGLAGGTILNYYGLGLLVPAIYTGTISLINPKVKESKLPETQFRSNEYYKYGYESVKAKKKTKAAAIYGIIGVAVMAGTISIFY